MGNKYSKEEKIQFEKIKRIIDPGLNEVNGF